MRLQWLLAACLFLASACTAARTPATATTERSKSMPAKVEVELDIFSGMPNPTWVLTDADTDIFMKQLAAAPPGPSTNLSGNLGYRGFIVQVTQAPDTQLIHIQAGAIHISKGPSKMYARDGNRELERWLLATGKPHLKNEIFQTVQREIR
jgi:hypothetical protein